MTSRYIPDSYTEVVNHPDGLKAVVHIEPETLTAKGYSGKRSKSDFHIQFTNRARLEAHIEKFFAQVTRQNAALQERRAAKKQAHSLEVGTIVYNTWGYDQTNVDFYEVVGRTPYFVQLRLLESELTGQRSDMSGYAVPKPGKYKGAEISRHRVAAYESGAKINFPHGGGSVWDGKPKYVSWYA